MIFSVAIYALLFFSLYFEVFLFITYIEKRKIMKTEYLEKREEYWPSTAIIPYGQRSGVVLSLRLECCCSGNGRGASFSIWMG